MIRFVLLIAVIASISSSYVVADEQSDQVDKLFATWDKDDSPGAVVAIVKDGETLYSNGYGLANLEHGVSNSPKTIFHVASVSKQFTAFAIFLLEQDEKLSIDDDVRKYIPELPDFGETIRIRHLIHHTSGLRDQWELLVFAGWRMDDVITHNDVLDLVKTQTELNFTPGQQYLYCNTGYTLLAEIVKRVSGKKLKKFCHERIFVPLEMNNTHFHDDHRQIVPNRSDCYWPAPGGWQKAVLSYAVVGATSLFTTTEDLAKWQRNFELMKVGNERVHERVVTRARLNFGKAIDYAGGVYHGKFEGHATLGHSGGDAGYVCHVERFPEHNLSVIVLANTSVVPAARLAHLAGKIYLDEGKEAEENDTFSSVTNVQMPDQQAWGNGSFLSPVDREPVAKTWDDVDLSEIAGSYYSPELDVSYELVVEDERLKLRRRKYGTQTCRRLAEDKFRVSSGLSMEIQLERDEDSKEVSGFRVNTSRVKNLQFEKRK